MSMRLAWRMACGPKREPVRFVTPISSGIPATVTGAVLSYRDTPRKVAGVAKVGASVIGFVPYG